MTSGSHTFAVMCVSMMQCGTGENKRLREKGYKEQGRKREGGN
jgi:hypothetical protein